MTILQAHKFFWKRDGASNYFLFLSDLLREKGHTVIPFSMHHPNARESEFEQYFVSQMDLDDPDRLSRARKMQFAGRMIYSLEAKHHMQRLLRDHSVDLVHLHNIYHHISPSILPVIKKRGIPIIMTLHDYKLICPNRSLFHHGSVHEEDCDGWYGTCVKNRCIKNSRAQSRLARWEMIFHHKIMRYYERYVDRFIAPSQFMIDLCVQHGWPRDKFIHIPNTIDIDQYTPTKNDGDAVVYAGGLIEEKGVAILLEAAALTPEIPYRIIGTGPQEQQLKTIAQKKRVTNVVFAGFLTGVELTRAMQRARLLVLPSLWYENNPLSILEAGAMEKITIGSRRGGIPEMLPTECLTEFGNAQDLAARISLWYSAPAAKRRALGKTLRAKVIAENHPDVHLKQILMLYHLLQS